MSDCKFARLNPAASRHNLRILLPALLLGLLLPLIACAADSARRGATTDKTPAKIDTTNGFGFTGPETYPIENAIANLHAADIDGDGLTDIVLVNNLRSKITFLYNQTGKTNTSAKNVRLEMNELPPDARFRIESIASEKRIAAFAIADLNGDKKPDIAYYGEPKELVVQYNQGTNGWSSPKTWPIDDGQLSPNALSTGDLNGDGRTDLVLLGETCLYFLAQNAEHSLAEPRKIPFSGSLKSVQVMDIDGDGRDDLLLVNWENANPFRFRLQTAAAQLGPEMYFAFPPIRSYWADDLNGDHKTEIITIAMNSGRGQISSFVKSPTETISGEFRQGQFNVLPLAKTTKAKRGIAWGDVNGDGRPDLLVAEPENGQLTIYLQQDDGSLSDGKGYPTLTGVSELAVCNRGNDQPADIFLLSPDERQVGLAHLDKQGRLPFPTILRTEGKPITMTAGSLKANESATLAVILDQDGKRALYLRGPEGDERTIALSEKFKSNPSSMAIQDVNQDGLADLVILIPYDKIKILVQKSAKDWNEIDVTPPGGILEQPWMSIADVDGDGKDELLLGQKNFLRAVVLKPDPDTNTWSLVVKDQINGATSNSRILGAAALRNGSNAVPSIFLLDAERKALTLCERDTNSVWKVTRNLPLPFTDFNALQPVALGGGTHKSIGYLGLNAVGWTALDGDAWTISELDGYETPIKDAQLHDVISGDLNGDKRKDLLFLETSKNYLDIVKFDESLKLVPATRWQVFEQRTTRSRQVESEPREALIADVTGDGKNDLIVIVHDRILVYPQE
jgi:hypothetical protein